MYEVGSIWLLWQQLNEMEFFHLLHIFPYVKISWSLITQQTVSYEDSSINSEISVKSTYFNESGQSKNFYIDISQAYFCINP